MKHSIFKILLVSWVLFSAHTLIAQNSAFHFPTLKERIEQHDISAEATIVSVDTVIDSTYIHTLYTLQVHKIFKGEPTEQLFVRMAEPKEEPIFEDSHEKDNHIPKIQIGYQGLFLINDYPSISPNGVSYYLDDAIIYPNQIYYDLGKSPFIPDYQFSKIEGKQTYSDFLNSFPLLGISYQEVSPITFIPFVVQEKPNPFAVDSVTRAERERLEQIEEEYIKKKIEEQKLKKKVIENPLRGLLIEGENILQEQLGANDEISFGFDDFKYFVDENNGKKYLQFDVTTNDNVDNSYISQTYVCFTFNEDVFGTDIRSDVLYETKGISNNTEAYNVFLTNSGDDGYDNDLCIFLEPLYDQGFVQKNRAELPDDPTTMVTLKLPILDCGSITQPKDVDLSWYDAEYTHLFSEYNASANSPMSSNEAYGLAAYGESENHNACVPLITGVTKDVVGGNNEFLTIEGRFFGEGDSLGRSIDLPNADRYYIDTANHDNNRSIIYSKVANQFIGKVKFWSDDKIEVYVPNEGRLNSKPSDRIVPGSGSVRVQNAMGVISDFSTNLNSSLNANIQGSLINYGDELVNHKLLHTLNTNNKNEFVVDIHKDLQQYPGLISCIQFAMNYWRCEAGVNFKVGKVVDYDVSNISHVATDNYSIIFPWDYGVNNTTTIAGTIKLVNPENCGSDYYRNEVDIRISKYFLDNKFFFDTNPAATKNGRTDFLHTMIHELGHALGLDHTIMLPNSSSEHEYDNIMFWTDGYTPSNSRNIVFTDDDLISSNTFLSANGGIGCGTPLSHSVPWECSNTASDFSIYGMNITSECYPEFSTSVPNPQIIPLIHPSNQTYFYEWINHNNETELDSYTARNPIVIKSSGDRNVHYTLRVTNTDGVYKEYEFFRKLFTQAKYDNAMRDNWHDDYEEPNIVKGFTQQPWHFTNSPDIWNSYTADGMQHEDPEYKENSTNFLRVRIRNIGCIRTNDDETFLKLYWTKASAGEDWEEDWTGASTGQPGGDPFNPSAVSGGEITQGNGLPIVKANPSEEFIMTVPWEPINPASYPNLEPNELTEYRAICVLARIVQPNNLPSFGMTHQEKRHEDGEVDNMIYNVEYNNDVITRNLKVYDRNPLDLVIPTVMGVKNTSGIARNIDIDIENSGLYDLGELAKEGIQTVIYLDQTLHRKWEQNGGLGTGFRRLANTAQLLVTDPLNFSIQDINLDAGEFANLKVMFVPTTDILDIVDRTSKHDIQFAITEKYSDSGKSTGAVHFLIKDNETPFAGLQSPESEPLKQLSEAEIAEIVEDKLRVYNEKRIQKATGIISTSGFDIEYNVHPNPSTGIFNLKGHYDSNESLVLTVKDMSGKSVYVHKMRVDGNFNHQIDLSHVSPGMYLLELEMNGKKEVKKLSKQ